MSRRLELAPADLGCQWDSLQLRGATVPTHVLAEAAIHSGRFHAIKYRSERDPTGINLVVYCDLVSPPDRVVVRDPSGNIVGHIP